MRHWRRLLRVPWSARRSNQSILKEISPEYSLEGLMLKLKLQYFGHLMRRTDSLEKTLMLGKIEGRRRRGRQKLRWLDGITDTMHMSLSKIREIMKDREAWCAFIYGAAKSWTQPSDWTTATAFLMSSYHIHTWLLEKPYLWLSESLLAKWCLCFSIHCLRFVIAFPSRGKSLLISCLQSPSAVILELKKIKSATATTFSPSICHDVMGQNAMILVFECWVSSQLLTLLFHPHQEAL